MNSPVRIEARAFLRALSGRRWPLGPGTRLQEAVTDALRGHSGSVVIDFTGVSGSAIMDFFWGLTLLEENLAPEELGRCLVAGLDEADQALLHRALAAARELRKQGGFRPAC